MWPKLEKYSRNLVVEGKDGMIAEGKILIPKYTGKAIYNLQLRSHLNKYLNRINLTFSEGRQKAKGKRQEAKEI